MPSSTDQLYSGRLRPFSGIPGNWSATKQAIAASVLQNVLNVCPEMLSAVEADADPEDFWEDACRISAAYLASGKQLTFKKPGTASSPWGEDAMARRLGPVARDEEGGNHAADTQINHPLVQKFGGRAMKLGSLGGNPRTDVIQWLAARHRDAGVTHGVIKAAANKSGVWSIELDSDPVVVGKRIMQALEWDFITLEERTNAVFAQDRLELEYEYRLFVVDGEVISGAGCIEEFTPLDRNIDDGSFDTRVRRVRGYLDQGAPTRVEYRIDVVAPLVTFGSEVAAEHGGTVVIDVALDAAAGRALGHAVPVVIELNSISNSGLYASDPWLVTERLVDAHDRGYQLPPAALASPHATLIAELP